MSFVTSGTFEYARGGGAVGGGDDDALVPPSRAPPPEPPPSSFGTLSARSDDIVDATAPLGAAPNDDGGGAALVYDSVPQNHGSVRRSRGRSGRHSRNRSRPPSQLLAAPIDLADLGGEGGSHRGHRSKRHSSAFAMSVEDDALAPGGGGSGGRTGHCRRNTGIALVCLACCLLLVAGGIAAGLLLGPFRPSPPSVMGATPPPGAPGVTATTTAPPGVATTTASNGGGTTTAPAATTTMCVEQRSAQQLCRALAQPLPAVCGTDVAITAADRCGNAPGVVAWCGECYFNEQCTAENQCVLEATADIVNPYYRAGTWRLWANNTDPVDLAAATLNVVTGTVQPLAEGERLYFDVVEQAALPYPSGFLATTTNSSKSNYAGWFDEAYSSADNGHTKLRARYADDHGNSIDLDAQMVARVQKTISSTAKRTLGVGVTSESYSGRGHYMVGTSSRSTEQSQLFTNLIRAAPAYLSIRETLANRSIDSYDALFSHAFSSVGRSGSEMGFIIKTLVAAGYATRSTKFALKVQGMDAAMRLLVWRATLPYATATGAPLPFDHELLHRAAYQSYGYSAFWEWVPHTSMWWYHRYYELRHLHRMCATWRHIDDEPPPISMVKLVELEHDGDSTEDSRVPSEINFGGIHTMLKIHSYHNKSVVVTFSLLPSVVVAAEATRPPLHYHAQLLYHNDRSGATGATLRRTATAGGHEFQLEAPYNPDRPRQRLVVVCFASRDAHDGDTVDITNAADYSSAFHRRRIGTPAFVNVYWVPPGQSDRISSTNYYDGQVRNNDREVNRNARPVLTLSPPLEGEVEFEGGVLRSGSATITCEDPEGYPTQFYTWLGDGYHPHTPDVYTTTTTTTDRWLKLAGVDGDYDGSSGSVSVVADAPAAAVASGGNSSIGGAEVRLMHLICGDGTGAYSSTRIVLDLGSGGVAPMMMPSPGGSSGSSSRWSSAVYGTPARSGTTEWGSDGRVTIVAHGGKTPWRGNSGRSGRAIYYAIDDSSDVDVIATFHEISRHDDSSRHAAVIVGARFAEGLNEHVQFLEANVYHTDRGSRTARGQYMSRRQDRIRNRAADSAPLRTATATTPSARVVRVGGQAAAFVRGDSSSSEWQQVTESINNNMAATYRQVQVFASAANNQAVTGTTLVKAVVQVEVAAVAIPIIFINRLQKEKDPVGKALIAAASDRLTNAQHVFSVDFHAPSGATVRFTTDGTEPTAASTAYTAGNTNTELPRVVGQYAIKARAFMGSTPSDVAMRTFEITSVA